jgi:hypothetical protein
MASTPRTPMRSERGGSPTAERLASRAERGALKRSSMPGGGEVFSGDLASRALKTLGARAMTVDRSIIVSDDFDSNRPEDQALFAHEQFHVEHSGGQGSHEHRDGEEVAARAVERMVLHRARAGGSESHEASHAVPDTETAAKGGHGSSKRQNQENDSDAQRGYEMLLAQGMDRTAIIDRLAHDVIQALDHGRDGALERFADKKGFL